MKPPNLRTAPLKKSPPRIEELVRRKTLLLGETNSGKSRFTFNFLCHLLEQKSYNPTDISILEFAPTRLRTNQMVIGGTLQEILQESNSLSKSLLNALKSVHWIDRESIDSHAQVIPKILTARYSARSTQDVLKACCTNFAITQNQLLHFSRNPTKVLIVNDVSIYLHLGGVTLLKKVLAFPETSLLNAYYGRSLLEDRGSYISRREEIMLLLLSKSLDTYLCDQFPS